jgi:hypothetical protein
LCKSQALKWHCKNVFDNAFMSLTIMSDEANDIITLAKEKHSFVFLSARSSFIVSRLYELKWARIASAAANKL